ncbi:helix-turn-helix transcriptional regulator [Paenibacillus senegalensis]|uniref:helix-turn-helix transcriptional regulator n=1 Tax=Paenibacillus senegalensis TaxID=1465766 RepID=UPI00028A02EA|nr:AraC family transcriptional regulator [Paenibacillus senegalensis]
MKLQVGTDSLEKVFQEFEYNVHLSSQQAEHEIYSIPTEIGEGTCQRIYLKKGLEINWFDARFRDLFALDIDVQYPHLEISYSLEGSGNWELSGGSRNYDLKSGTSSLLFVRDEKVHAELSPHERMLQMEIRMDIRHLNMHLPELDSFLEKSFFCTQVADAPQISLIVEQMKQCPYSGALRRLYLEGKAYELLAFHLDHAGAKREQSKSQLTAEDIRCLYEARQFLSHTWRQPPSLVELARLCGLNDYKLKLGFKELFGTTVFGYVRSLRMNEARKILEEGKVNVSEAASMVGYHNFSHFSALFRKTIGYNPSEVRRASFHSSQTSNT